MLKFSIFLKTLKFYLDINQECEIGDDVIWACPQRQNSVKVKDN